jgi:predicted nucleic acid-binding protein
LIVVDASVATKWILPEVGSDAALAILDSAEELAAPQLVAVEVASAIVKALRSGRIQEATAETYLDDWDETLRGLQLSPDWVDLKRAIEIGLRTHHLVQDCLYLALAERLECPLVTADRRFAERVAASHPFVRALPDSA